MTGGRPVIETTGDGSATLRSALHGDTYHSTHGAAAESRHVFIESGFNHIPADPARILEVGFGAGLNAWLTLTEAAIQGRRVEYTAVELHPVPADIAAALGYTDEGRFMEMHRSPWGEAAEISEGFRLLKLASDLAVTEFSGIFDLVYFDAFAPDTQPELWTEAVFGRIYGAMAAGGTLVTYSAKGSVKRALRAAGFAVERLPGAPGKRHMLRAVKNI